MWHFWNIHSIVAYLKEAFWRCIWPLHLAFKIDLYIWPWVFYLQSHGKFYWPLESSWNLLSFCVSIVDCVRHTVCLSEFYMLLQQEYLLDFYTKLYWIFNSWISSEQPLQHSVRCRCCIRFEGRFFVKL